MSPECPPGVPRSPAGGSGGPPGVIHGSPGGILGGLRGSQKGTRASPGVPRSPRGSKGSPWDPPMVSRASPGTPGDLRGSPGVHRGSRESPAFPRGSPGVPGSLRGSPGIPGDPQGSSGVPGDPRGSPGVLGNPWRSLGILGESPGSPGIPEGPRRVPGIPGGPRESHRFLGIPRGPGKQLVLPLLLVTALYILINADQNMFFGADREMHLMWLGWFGGPQKCISHPRSVTLVTDPPRLWSLHLDPPPTICFPGVQKSPKRRPYKLISGGFFFARSRGNPTLPALSSHRDLPRVKFSDPGVRFELFFGPRTLSHRSAKFTTLTNLENNTIFALN